MKKFSIIAFALFSCLPVKGEVLSLNELLSLFEKNSVQVKVENTKLLEVDYRIKEHEAIHRPKLKAIIGGERRQVPSEENLDKSNFVGQLQLDYNLFSFGRHSKQIQAMKSERKQRSKITAFKIRSLKLALESYYYHALFFKNQMQLLKQEISFNKVLKKQVERRRKQGLVSNVDILEVNMRDASLKKKMLQNEEDYEHTIDLIRKLIFAPHEFKVDVAGKIPHKHYQTSEKALLESMKKKNVALASAFNQLEVSDFKMRSASAARLPQINFKGRVGKMRLDDQFSTDKMQGLVGLYIDVPLFDGKLSSQHSVSKAIYERRKLKLEEVKNRTGIDLIHSYEKLTNFHEQVDLAERNVKNANLYFKSVSAEYNRGVKNSIDLVSARDKLATFREDLLTAKRDYILTKIKLEKISGSTITE
jgi:outer membrane protein